MNFIDEALHNCHNGEELVQALADIYKHPDVRIKLRDYPEWINDIIAIIDYDIELQMEGLDFRTYEREIQALNNMGIFEEASVLSLISAASSDKEVEDCYSKLALNNDYDEFWNIVYSFADKNLRK